MRFQMGFCDIFGFLFVWFCVRNEQDKKLQERFRMEYQWSYVNFTWPSYTSYNDAVTGLKYVPENNVITGMKYYDGKMFLTLARLLGGTPATLAYMSAYETKRTNPLLKPFPSWEMNVLNNCTAFQNVQNVEIDKYGVMWVLDGVRINDITKCPPKIVLLDLKNDGEILQVHEFPNYLSLHNGGFLKNIVVDETDGGFAYITDNSMQDPGIVIYSRHFNRSWKIRDATMFAELDATAFMVDDVINENPTPVSGIALAPLPKLRTQDRSVYYCAVSGLNLYSIGSSILKNEQLCKSGQFRKSIKKLGRKQSQSDGLAMDQKGNLYYGMISKYGIGKWNIRKPFSTARKLETNRNYFNWPDNFAFDTEGHLYVIANRINQYLMPSYQHRLSEDIKFRILKLITGTKSYLYSS